MRWARSDKWQCHSLRWRGMESSRNFSCDTCLSKFDQGWVRDHQSPSGSKKYQREDTNQITRWLISLTNIYMWIPHPRDPEAGILHIVRNCCWFLEKNIRFLGDLSFVWGEEGLPCWEDDAGSEQLVVTPLGSFLFINKSYSSFPPYCCVIYVLCTCISDPSLFMIIDPCSCIVLCYCDLTSTLWSRAYKGASSERLSRERGIKLGD